ncbi:MAG TPA: hypothetical protein VEU33_31770 [Archangium sp.]|nr:hypothetical protein [Archangium sp.]
MADNADNPHNAEFRVKNGPTIKTHFNPSSLRITRSTRLIQPKGTKQGTKQVASGSNAKLSVELIFDTTATGSDVCDKTLQLARLVGEKDKTPAHVTFLWGNFRFDGVVDSFQETLDFFSDKGTALRSTVALTLSKDEVSFEKGREATKLDEEAVEIKTSRSTTETAMQGGDSAAGRDVAAMNGEESMRFPSARSLVVNSSVSRAPPASFTSPEAAPQGAFSGLRTVPTRSAPARLDANQLLRKVGTNTLPTGSGASFDLGGRMTNRIHFEEE